MARDYAEIGYLIGASRLRIAPADYRTMREAGYRWCSHHGGWQHVSDFKTYPNAGRRSYCVEAERIRARAWRRRHREQVAS